MAAQAKSSGAKSAPKPPPEIKEIIAPSLQFARLRCDCSDCNHAPPGQAPAAGQPSTGWFRGLYALLAKNPPPPPPVKENEEPVIPEKPVFTLWATDGDGYLSPVDVEAPPPPPPPPPEPNTAPAGQTTPATPAPGAAAPPAPAAQTPTQKPEEDPKAPELPDAPGAIADPIKAVPLVPGEEYLLYLILHPKKEVADEFLEQANGDGIKDGAKFLKKLVLDRERTGEMLDKKKNTRTIVEEPVFKVPDTAFLTIPGGELYGGFTLFGMPFQRKFFATDVNKKPFSATLPFFAMPNNPCPHIKNQVARLQAHLGALRFPVGTQDNPYFSQRQGALTVALVCPSDKKPRDFPIVFENPGVFDALTYNAVLSFQRHAVKGNYVKLKDGRALYDKMFEGKTFDLKGQPDVADGKFAMRESVSYLELDPPAAKPWDAPALGSPEFKGEATGVCDPDTATEIGRWLENGFRKLGHVMRAIFPNGSPDESHPVDPKGLGEWMRDDAAPIYLEWVLTARSMGAHQDVLGTHVFRDIRDMITGTAPGKIRDSIHKTGLAVDTAPHNGYQNTYPAYSPIVSFELEKFKDRRGNEKSKIRWRLFEDVGATFNEATHGKARDRFASAHGVDPKLFYPREVVPWKFDSNNPQGGQSLPIKKGLFLDITRIAATLGWNRISAASGIGSSPSNVILIDSTRKKTIVDVAKDAIVAIERTAAQNGALDVVVERPGAGLTILTKAGSLKTAVVKRWIDQMKFHEFFPQPEILLDLPSIIRPVDREKLQRVVRDEFAFDSFVLGLKTSGGGIAILEGVEGGSALIENNPDLAFLVPTLGPLWIQSGDTVTTYKSGIPRTREWWHFQHDKLVGSKTAESTSWYLSLEKIGWQKEGMRALGYLEEDMTPQP